MNHSAHTSSSTRVTVWDPFVRVFHWSLASFFIVAYLTEDDWLYLHSFAGYCISALVLFRIFWGLIGTRYARFSSFVSTPKVVLAYLKSLISGHPTHYMGHNPAGGAMVLLMLVVLALTAFTGMATLATEGMGPLANTFFAGLSDDLLEELHEFLANVMLALVLIHLAGVVVSSFVHRENLIRAMVDGRKRAASEEKS